MLNTFDLVVAAHRQGREAAGDSNAFDIPPPYPRRAWLKRMAWRQGFIKAMHGKIHAYLKGERNG